MKYTNKYKFIGKYEDEMRLKIDHKALYKIKLFTRYRIEDILPSMNQVRGSVYRIIKPW